ncbi:MAG: CoA transferase, partial [Candidatus Binatia bacterium]
GEELAGEEWDDFFYRREHAEELFAALDRFVGEQNAADILEGAQLRRLPFAAVKPPEAMLDDPQLAARGFFSPLEREGSAAGLLFPGPPFRMSTTPLRTRRGAPAPGSSGWPSDERSAAVASASPAAPAGRRSLDGIRVLDFTHVVAGPVATRILADHGAEVLKIERTVTLDLGDRQRGFFSNLNRGKKSLIFNMADPRGVELAHRLAAKSDVVIDNFSARVMGNWGLDYEGLRELRRDVIAVGMSGFGKTGPHRDYVSFGPTLHALAGYTMIMRHPGGEPAGWGYSYSDMCGGMNGAVAVLAALWHRSRTGEGQFIDLSQLESVATLMGPVLLQMANDHLTPKPVANRSQEAPAAPHGVYRAAGEDRWVAIAVSSDEDWRR